MHSSLIDASIVSLLTTRLLNHHHHHSSATKAKEDIVTDLLNLFISTHEVLMCTPSILDSLNVALDLLSPVVAQHGVVTLYSLLSIEAYRSIIGSKKPLVIALMDLLGTPPSTPTRSIKDVLKALFSLTLYLLNSIALIELGIMSPLFLVVKDRWRVVVEDAMVVIAWVTGCDDSIKSFRRVDNISVLVDLVVGGSRRARENVAVTLLNLVKSDGNKTVGDVKEVNGAKAAMRALVSGNSRVSMRGKSKAEVLSRVLESGWGSQL
ncbi:U-box domain-containing protein 15-like [Musa acuminata AAA Group]|uniref:U-box domain-containing protein 15-like n=1 Tax=Musa acuminata AAA Group TaxID=214697 RepID=UPI0031D36957